MKIFGFYPFTVHVANTFDPALKVNLEVIHYQHCTYFKQLEGIGGSVITQMTSPDGESTLSNCQIEIPGGHCIAFPMQYGNEKVEISLEDSLVINYSYTISVGVKAICRLCKYDGGNDILDGEDGVEFTESCFEELEPFATELKKFGHGFHVGGTWKISTSFNNGWMLEIRKHNFDPEDVSVPIGTQTPG
jgi:hypothetical protein